MLPGATLDGRRQLADDAADPPARPVELVCVNRAELMVVGRRASHATRRR